MANELHINWATAKSLDRYITDASQQRYNGSSFEAYNASHWTTYAAALTEQGSSGDYFGSLPTGLSSGTYDVTIRERQGGSAATTDPNIGGQAYYFDGSQWVSLLTLETQLNTISSNGTGGITLVSPVSATGDITVVNGDSYLATDGRQIEWSTTSAATWPDLTGATVTFVADKSGSNDNIGVASLTKSVSIITPTGATKLVRLELTSVDTASLAVWSNGYNFTVKATLANSSRVTLNRGTVTVLADQS